MQLDDLIQIGSLHKAHGTKGELKIIFRFPFFVGEEENLSNLFFGKPRPLPYFVESLQDTNSGYIIKLEGIDNRSTADEAAKKPVFLPKEVAESIFDLEEEENGEYGYLTGYTLLNADMKPLGTIDEVMLLPQHELARLLIEGKEVLIPLNEATITAIDEKQQTVVVQVPEGLLDLYLND